VSSGSSKDGNAFLACDVGPEQAVREALIRSGFEGDGLQAVRKYWEIIVTLAAEGLRRRLIRISLDQRRIARDAAGAEL